MRLVSQSGGVTLLPAPDSHVHIQGSVRIGSSDMTCDHERRGLVRFSRRSGPYGEDELLLCAVMHATLQHDPAAGHFSQHNVQ
jgi:hypothetical protein